MKTTVIMLAGGSGTRMKAPVNKILLSVCGKPAILRSMEAFAGLADNMIVVCRPQDESAVRDSVERTSLPFSVRIVHGGNTRQASVLNGLLSLRGDPGDIVLIHDAARCLVDGSLIRRVIDSVRSFGTGIPAIPVSSTYKICDGDGMVLQTPDRSGLYEIQTPQGFRSDLIVSVSKKAADEHVSGTDDASLLEYYGLPVRIVPGSPENIKLTSPNDLRTAEIFLEGVCPAMRIGMGYDVHRLTEGRKLFLCGVEIPWEYGLLGHSDADVALHALMDAMFGACALGDIGSHFPDTEERYSGISSMKLLAETVRILSESGFAVYNIDLTIVAQKPKLLPYIPQMRNTLSSALKLPDNRISVKATTTEKLGFEGRMEGISAYAVCMVSEK